MNKPDFLREQPEVLRHLRERHTDAIERNRAYFLCGLFIGITLTSLFLLATR